MQSEYEFLKEQVGERPQVEKYPYKASDFFMGLGSNILATWRRTYFSNTG